MKRLVRAHLVCLMLLLLAAAGCVKSSGGQGTSCSSSAECPAGSSCVSGRCIRQQGSDATQPLDQTNADVDAQGTPNDADAMGSGDADPDSITPSDADILGDGTLGDSLSDTAADVSYDAGDLTPLDTADVSGGDATADVEPDTAPPPCTTNDQCTIFAPYCIDGTCRTCKPLEFFCLNPSVAAECNADGTGPNNTLNCAASDSGICGLTAGALNDQCNAIACTSGTTAGCSGRQQMVCDSGTFVAKPCPKGQICVADGICVDWPYPLLDNTETVDRIRVSTLSDTEVYVAFSAYSHPSGNGYDILHLVWNPKAVLPAPSLVLPGLSLTGEQRYFGLSSVPGKGGFLLWVHNGSASDSKIEGSLFDSGGAFGNTTTPILTRTLTYFDGDVVYLDFDIGGPIGAVSYHALGFDNGGAVEINKIAIKVLRGSLGTLDVDLHDRGGEFGLLAPRVATWQDGGYMVSWRDGNAIFYQCVDKTGKPLLGTPGTLAVPAATDTRAVSLPSGEPVVIWNSGSGLRLATIDAACKLGTPIPVNSANVGFDFDAASDASGVVAVVYTLSGLFTNPGAGLFLNLYQGTTPIGKTIRVMHGGNGPSYPAVTLMSNHRALILWHNGRDNLDSGMVSY